MFDSILANVVVITAIVLAHAGLLLAASGVYVNRRNRG